MDPGLVVVVLVQLAFFVVAAFLGKWWLLLLPVLFWPLVIAQMDWEPYPIVASLYAAIAVGAVLAGLLVRWMVLRGKGAGREDRSEGAR